MATRVERFRHAEVQRQHRQRHKLLGIPRKEDVGLAAIESWRREMARWQALKKGQLTGGQIVNIEEWRAGQLVRLFQGTVAVLVERGFDKGQSGRRLKQLSYEGDLVENAKAVRSDRDDSDNEAAPDRITG